MVLGEHAYERGAWANRITESEAGVGYVWGEGIREPLRIRAGWVPDEVIKQLETFITNPVTRNAAVKSLLTSDQGGMAA
jgi:S-DNA-T family DNA segregation ATPase FtsK/SpoIIIE